MWLCYKSALSSITINKLVKAGIDANVLKDTFNKKGNDGIRILFSESVQGKPRVTNSSKIINKVC